MISHRGVSAIFLIGLAALVALTTLGCNITDAPGRFTSVVKYEVTAEFVTTAPNTVDISYEDDAGTQTPATFTAPQSFEFTMDYDYSSPFDPAMAFNSATFADPGYKLFIKIIWKDYRTNFEEEVLASAEISSTGGATTIYGPPLPE